MLISTILGRFGDPVYYVLGERFRSRGERPEEPVDSTEHVKTY